MSEDKKKFRQVALEQLKLMLDFMAQHPDFALGSLRNLEARHQSKLRWTELTKILNNHRGAKKTHYGWSKYWSDFKNKLKKKLIERKRKKPGSVKKDRPFTKLEKQALVILGPMFEKRRGEKLESTLCDPLPIEIKQESMLETALSTNGHYKLAENDVLLGLESGDSEHSSDEECEEDVDQSSYEPLLNGIYPKWLMDIERKRAEADLKRARAEELRAEVSVKTTESALIQAEALKKLSEAAEKQAEAILRIAMVMENRPGLINTQSRHPSEYQ